MSLQYSTALRNAQLNAIESTIGTDALFRIYTGSVPATPATAASGALLVEIGCPTDWMAAASSGSVAKSGTWSGTAIADGTAGYWRLYDSTGTTCGAQGTVTASGGGGDAIIDNTSIATGQVVTVTTFTVAAGNA